MTSPILSNHQRALVKRPIESKIFLKGTGKTSAGVARLLHLLDSGVPARFVLVIVPRCVCKETSYASVRRRKRY